MCADNLPNYNLPIYLLILSFRQIAQKVKICWKHHKDAGLMARESLGAPFGCKPSLVRLLQYCLSFGKSWFDKLWFNIFNLTADNIKMSKMLANCDSANCRRQIERFGIFLAETFLANSMSPVTIIKKKMSNKKIKNKKLHLNYTKII